MKTKISKEADRDIRAYLKECSKLKGAALREAYAVVVGRDTNETSRERLLNGIARILYHNAEQGAVVPVFEHPEMGANLEVKEAKKPSGTNTKSTGPAFDNAESDTAASSASNGGDTGTDADVADAPGARDAGGHADAAANGADIGADVANAPDNANVGAATAPTTAGTLGAKKRRVTRTPGVRDLRLPAAGTVLEKAYKGVVHKVTLLQDNGCMYEGKQYKSLSAVAKVIAGCNHNGLLFFGIIKRESKKSNTDEATPAA